MARLDREEQIGCKIEVLYTEQVFPHVSGIFGGEVIMKCSKGEFSSGEGDALMISRVGIACRFLTLFIIRNDQNLSC